MYSIRDVFVTQSHILLNSYFFFQKYIEKQIAERKKKLHEDRLLKERAVKEKKQKLEVPFLNITAIINCKIGEI